MIRGVGIGGKRRCETGSPLDLQLVVDSSGTVGEEAFKRLVRILAEDFLPRFASSGKNRIAFATFAGNAKIANTL